jgi:hypothetical protein
MKDCPYRHQWFVGAINERVPLDLTHMIELVKKQQKAE